ncbi:MAG: hypothetical protein ACLSHG_09050 [Oscillospiraceae bacterium]
MRRTCAGAGRGHRAARAAADECPGAVRRRHAPPRHAAAAVVPTPTPEPDNGLPKVNTGSWELTLVNAQNSIGEAVPEDLAELESGRYFDACAVDALKDFIAGARAEGLSVCLSSAYRSYNEQTCISLTAAGQPVRRRRGRGRPHRQPSRHERTSARPVRRHHG